MKTEYKSKDGFIYLDDETRLCEETMEIQTKSMSTWIPRERMRHDMKVIKIGTRKFLAFPVWSGYHPPKNK